MERSQHDVQDLAIRTRLPRFVKKPEPVDKSEDHELNLEAKSSTGSTPRKPASRRNSSHESIDESLEDDFSPGSRHRGHDYRHVQARENGRMQLGDNTYITTQNVYHDLKHPDRAGQGGKQIDLLEALAFDHMDTRLAGISVARGETCRWLFDTVQYSEWQACSRSSHHGFLWIKGKPGAGKSTMMKCALEEARNHPDACIVASFFFNARGHGTATTTEGMYRALLFQILTQLARRPTCVPEKVAAIWKEEGWPIPMLQDILRDTIYQVGKDYRIVFYIDALDECAEDDVREALQHLEELRDQAVHRGLRFHACFASRHFPNITMSFCQDFDLDKQEKHFQDITDYVDSVLRAPPSAHAELAKEIVARCAGIFLWAVLTVRILNKMHDHGATHSQLRARMRMIPAGIEDLFRDILERKDIYLVPTLLWMLFAKRALRLDELYFAIRASTNQLATGIWNPAEIDLEGMRSFVLKCSRGLVETSGEVPQLLHESLREYLLDKGLAELDPELKSDLEATCNMRLAEWCFSYLTPDTERYLGPHFGSTEATTKTDPSTGSTTLGERRMYHFQLTERLPFLGYVLARTMFHMGAGSIQSKPPAATLGRYADLWLTLRLDRSCTYATEHCAVLLCLSLARSHHHASSKSSRRSPTSFALIDFRKIEYWPAEGDSFHYLTEDALKILRVAADLSSVDSLQLLEDRKSTSDFRPLLGKALVFSAGAGSEPILDLLINSSKSARYTMLVGPLRTAVSNLQEGTTRLLLRRAFFSNRFSSKLGSILGGLMKDADPDRGDVTQARLNIAEALLDAGANFKGGLVTVLRNYRQRSRAGLVLLLVARGACMSKSQLQHVREHARDAETVRLLEESNIPILDSSDESDCSDASMEAKFVQFGRGG